MNPAVEDPEFPRFRELMAKHGGRGTEAAGRYFRAGYTVAQMREWGDEHLLDVFGIGPASVAMTREALAEMGQEEKAG